MVQAVSPSGTPVDVTAATPITLTLMATRNSSATPASLNILAGAHHRHQYRFSTRLHQHSVRHHRRSKVRDLASYRCWRAVL